MDGFRILRNTQVIILGVCIAVATIASSVILSQAFLRFQKATREVITVTGSANRQITSDLVIWQASLSVRELDLAKGYKRLNADLEKVKAYLQAKGIKSEQLIIPQISVAQLYKKDEHGNAYEASTTYGPFSGWLTLGLVMRPDNKLQLPWDRTADHAFSLWRLNNGEVYEGSNAYGPYAGWQVFGGDVDGSNKPHILWRNTNGSISIWRLSPTGSIENTANFGPY